MRFFQSSAYRPYLPMRSSGYTSDRAASHRAKFEANRLIDTHLFVMLLKFFQEQTSSDHPNASSVFSRISWGCRLPSTELCGFDEAHLGPSLTIRGVRSILFFRSWFLGSLCLYRFPMLLYTLALYGYPRNCFYGQIKHLYDTEKLKNMQQKDKQDKPLTWACLITQIIYY
jgi:hypothetical protein